MEGWLVLDSSDFWIPPVPELRDPKVTGSDSSSFVLALYLLRPGPLIRCEQHCCIVLMGTAGEIYQLIARSLLWLFPRLLLM